MSVSTRAMLQEESSSVPEQKQNPVTNFQIIVKFKPTAPESRLTIMSDASISRVSAIAGVEFKHLSQLGTGAHLLKIENTVSRIEVDKAIAKLMKDPNIEYVEQNQRMRTMVTPGHIIDIK